MCQIRCIHASDFPDNVNPMSRNVDEQWTCPTIVSSVFTKLGDDTNKYCTIVIPISLCICRVLVLAESSFYAI